MTVHGGGSGVPIVPVSSGASGGVSGSLLWRYCQIVGIDECAFWGVRVDGQTQYACRTIWTLSQRRQLARELAGAQADIEAEIGYRLGRGWETDEPHNISRAGRYLTDYGHVVAGGVQGISVILSGAPVNHAADPAVIGPVATTVTDIDEVHVFYPGSDYEVAPSKVTIVGGFLTVEIPRCRLVLESLWDNSEQGIDYADTANFVQTVDLKRVYNDTATQAEFVRPGCSCAETVTAGCIRVRRGVIGEIDVRMNACSTLPGCGCGYDLVRLNYYAGVGSMSHDAENAVIRLAHSRLPSEPCGCDVSILAWKADRNIPEVATRERINCPWGLSDGAWGAWTTTRRLRLMRGGVL